MRGLPPEVCELKDPWNDLPSPPAEDRARELAITENIVFP
jgi:hypothetical protein